MNIQTTLPSVGSQVVLSHLLTHRDGAAGGPGTRHLCDQHDCRLSVVLAWRKYHLDGISAAEAKAGQSHLTRSRRMILQERQPL